VGQFSVSGNSVTAYLVHSCATTGHIQLFKHLNPPALGRKPNSGG